MKFRVVVIVAVIIVVFIHLCDTHPIQKNLRPEGKTHGKFGRKYIHINKKSKILFVELGDFEYLLLLLLLIFFFPS